MLKTKEGVRFLNFILLNDNRCMQHVKICAEFNKISEKEVRAALILKIYRYIYGPNIMMTLVSSTVFNSENYIILYINRKNGTA